MNKFFKSLLMCILAFALILTATSCGMLKNLEKNVKNNVENSDIGDEKRESVKKNSEAETETAKNESSEENDEEKDKPSEENDKEKDESSEGSENNKPSQPTEVDKSVENEEIPEEVKAIVSAYDGFNRESINAVVAEGYEAKEQDKKANVEGLIKNLSDKKAKEVFKKLLTSEAVPLRKSTVKKTNAGDDEESYTVTTAIPDVKSAEDAFVKEINSIDISKEGKAIADKLLADKVITAETTEEDIKKLIEEALDKLFEEKALEILKKSFTKVDAKLDVKKTEEGYTIKSFEGVVTKKIEEKVKIA